MSVQQMKIEGWRAEVERAYRAEGSRLWKALLLFSGDPDIASDAVSEAFAQALARGDAITVLSAWVWRAAFRIAAGDLKDRSSSSPALGEASYEMQDPFPPVLEQMKRLSQKQRAAVVLHHYAGYGLAEVARIIGSTPAAVGVHLHRGRRRLRKLLEEDQDD